jgi:zinc D-Ala-D-Ala carboxypeptidase
MPALPDKIKSDIRTGMYLIQLIIILVLSGGSCKEAIDGVTIQQANRNELFENRDSFPAWVDIAYITGRFDPSVHPDFALIPLKYADKEGQYIRKDVLNAFTEMFEAAERDGIKLQVRSATRNFDRQKLIWENKWSGKTLLESGINALKDISEPVMRAKKILEYSSMPGTSRHHWGTDIDLNAFENEWFEKGEGLRLYRWMLEHASEYGFCQPYTSFSNERRTGYFEEKWHWTYMPVSSILTNYAALNLKNEMISGFEGADSAIQIGIVENYVLGIHPSCK